MLEKKAVLKQFFNCEILRNGQILKEDLWVRDGKVIDPEKIFYDEKIVPDFIIDCRGALISPGYIDLQVNGECFYERLFTIFFTKCIYPEVYGIFLI